MAVIDKFPVGSGLQAEPGSIIASLKIYATRGLKSMYMKRLMLKMVNISILLLLLSGLVSGCGGEGDGSDSNANFQTADDTKDAVLTEYQFFATIDRVNGTPPFAADIGDSITGTFSFDPKVQDTYVASNVGSYPQTAPASVQIEVGSVVINADLNNWLGYRVNIYDNDSSVAPTRDIFRWHVNDTVLAASYGLDYIQAGFLLRDFTATVFTSNEFPDNLDLNDFSDEILSLSGNKADGKAMTISWYLHSQIIYVNKLN